MLTIRRETDYAIQILKLLAKSKKKFLSLNDLSDTTGISFLFLQKIARKLRIGGLIKAGQGAGGGYALNLPAKKISLKNIIEAVEGPCAILPCLAGAERRRVGFCGDKKFNCVKKGNQCALQDKMKKLNGNIVKMMEKTKLNSL